LTTYARDATELRLLGEQNPFMDDLTPRKQAVETERFGKLWEVVMLSVWCLGRSVRSYGADSYFCTHFWTGLRVK
jgi:hypothetical protein